MPTHGWGWVWLSILVSFVSTRGLEPLRTPGASPHPSGRPQLPLLPGHWQVLLRLGLAEARDQRSGLVVSQGCHLLAGSDVGDTLEYNPNLLDDPQWPCGKHKRVLIFASYMVWRDRRRAHTCHLQGGADVPSTPGTPAAPRGGGTQPARQRCWPRHPRTRSALMSSALRLVPPSCGASVATGHHGGRPGRPAQLLPCLADHSDRVREAL